MQSEGTYPAEGVHHHFRASDESGDPTPLSRHPWGEMDLGRVQRQGQAEFVVEGPGLLSPCDDPKSAFSERTLHPLVHGHRLRPAIHLQERVPDGGFMTSELLRQPNDDNVAHYVEGTGEKGSQFLWYAYEVPIGVRPARADLEVHRFNGVAEGLFPGDGDQQFSVPLRDLSISAEHPCLLQPSAGRLSLLPGHDGNVGQHRAQMALRALRVPVALVSFRIKPYTPISGRLPGEAVAGVLRTSWKALLAQAFRRYFVNTVFDSTFVSMGIVVASALVPGAGVGTVVGTMFAATLALGISTGTSVYEAEKVEAEIRLRELERAMLTSLDGTEATRVLDVSRYIVVTVNVVAPLAVFLAMAAPFLLSGSMTIFGIPTAFFSVAVAMVVLFTVGWYLARLTGRPAWLKGLRMAGIGVATFGAIWFIQGFVLG